MAPPPLLSPSLRVPLTGPAHSWRLTPWQDRTREWVPGKANTGPGRCKYGGSEWEHWGSPENYLTDSSVDLHALQMGLKKVLVWQKTVKFCNLLRLDNISPIFMSELITRILIVDIETKLRSNWWLWLRPRDKMNGEIFPLPDISPGPVTSFNTMSTSGDFGNPLRFGILGPS